MCYHSNSAHCNSASRLGYLSMLYQEKSENSLWLWFSVSPHCCNREDPYPHTIPYFTDTGCMHALPWQTNHGIFVCLIFTYSPCSQNSLQQLRQRDNTIAKGVAGSHAVPCKHKGAGLHLKCQKRASEDNVGYGRRLSAGAKIEWSVQQLPLRCPSFRGHCCAQIQSKSNSSGGDGGSTGEGLS